MEEGFKELSEAWVLLSSHNYGTLTNQIGIAEKVKVEDGKLIAKFKYFTNSGNPEADWGWFLAKQGLAAYSVGFLPRPNGYETASWDEDDVKSGKKPVRTYTDVELLEISQVTVPANPSALQKSMEDNEDPFIKEYSEMVYQKLFSKQEEIIPLEEDFSDMITRDLEDNEKDLDEDVETKPDTEGYIHIAAPGQEGKHGDHKIRTISISSTQGIQAHYCVDCKKNTGYLFAKSKGWTHEKAAAWVEKHSKTFEMLLISDISLQDENQELPVILEVTFEELQNYIELTSKEFEDFLEEDKKKRPKGGCKSEEEEEMILKAIEELKVEMSARFTKIEDKFAQWEKEDEEYKKDLEDFTAELEKEQKEIDEEDVVLNQLEEDEDYIKSLLSEQNALLATKFSVQSK